MRNGRDFRERAESGPNQMLVEELIEELKRHPAHIPVVMGRREADGTIVKNAITRVVAICTRKTEDAGDGQVGLVVEEVALALTI